MRRMFYYTIVLYLAIGVWGVWAADKIRLVEADVVRVIDGDTVKMRVHVWLGTHVNVRIRGIDTPEIRTKCAKEKKRARQAKHFLEKLLSGNVKLMNITRGKYAGRVMADVQVDGNDVAYEMIDKGHARPYHGGKRLPWC